VIPVFGLAISVDDFAGIFIAVLITAYLVYALITPEKL
jgi:K+-transporting ATPase KdpF subunit